MRKQVLAAAAAVVLAGTTIGFAQRFNGPGGPDGPPPPPHAPRWQPTPDDLSAFSDARIAAMKAGLRLTADQEKNWPAFEQAYRTIAKEHLDELVARRAARQSGEDRQAQRDDLATFIQKRAELMSKRATNFKQLADAMVPLYQSLDDAQKHRFNILFHALRARPMRFAAIHQRGMGPGWSRRDDRTEGMGPRAPRPREQGFEHPRFGGDDRGDGRGPFRAGPMGGDDEHTGLEDNGPDDRDRADLNDDDTEGL